MTTARDLMTANPMTIGVGSRVREAAHLLQTLDVRHLPVVDTDGTLVGMLSDRDLRGLSVPYLIHGEYAGNVQTALDTKVTTLMTTEVLSVEPESDASEIVELMLEHRIGAVPVIEADGTLVGIVSYIDVLREIAVDAQ